MSDQTQVQVNLNFLAILISIYLINISYIYSGVLSWNMKGLAKGFHRKYLAPGKTHYYYWLNPDEWFECGHCNRVYYDKFSVRLHQELKHTNKEIPECSISNVKYSYGKLTEAYTIINSTEEVPEKDITEISKISL